MICTYGFRGKTIDREETDINSQTHIDRKNTNNTLIYTPSLVTYFVSILSTIKRLAGYGKRSPQLVLTMHTTQLQYFMMREGI